MWFQVGTNLIQILPAPHWEPGATILVSPVRFRCAAPRLMVPRITWRVNRWQRSEDQPGVLGTRIHDRSHPGERCDWVAETTRIEGLGERAVLCRRDDPRIEPRFGGGTGTSDPYAPDKAHHALMSGACYGKPLAAGVITHWRSHRNSTSPRVRGGWNGAG